MVSFGLIVLAVFFSFKKWWFYYNILRYIKEAREMLCHI
jgi:hypothetical protein